MFVPLRAIDTIIVMPVLLLWLITCFMIHRITKPGLFKQLRTRARRGLIWLFLSEFLVLVKIGTLVLQWLYFGWMFVDDRVLIEVPLLFLPALMVLILSLPRIMKITRIYENASNTQAAVFEKTDVALVIPVQATALGAAICAYLIELYSDPIVAFVLVILFLFICPLLWFWQSRKKHADDMKADGGRRRLLRSIPGLTAVILAPPAWYFGMMQASRLPDRIPMTNHGDSGNHHGSMISVTELTGPKTGEPDHRFVLTAQEAQVKLSAGEVVDVWTFNGQIPGPQLRVRQGDLVEVVLTNNLASENVTIHWHGLDVPNAEDGVAGITQNAVRRGESYTYRFIAEDKPGSYWYHSHQTSSVAVQKGLFGTLVILPKEAEPVEEEIMVAAHTWKTLEDGSEFAFGTSTTLERKAIKPGTPVRLRLLNTNNTPTTFMLSGTTFKVAAIDGSDLNEPTELSNKRLLVGSGGRYDLTFIMPETPVYLGTSRKDTDKGLLLSRDGSGDVPEIVDGPVFNPATYGSPAEVPFGLNSRFDQDFTLILDGTLGFYDGEFGNVWPINGKNFPYTPMLMVREGDLVKTTFVNRSYMDHPMHLHGHHILVLAQNGKPVTGSPWWVDTLNVAPGEFYEVAFLADNPGIWMDHCHNLEHAVDGMVLHLGYEGVMSPFEVGRASGNLPE